MSDEQYGCRGCGPVPINHRPAITDDRFFYTYEGDRPVMWCPSCWAMPPDLAALLRAVDADPVTLGNLVGVRVACTERQAGFLGRADILADWLEDRGDRRSPRLRAMLSQPVVWLVNVLALFPPTWRA